MITVKKTELDKLIDMASEYYRDFKMHSTEDLNFDLIVEQSAKVNKEKKFEIRDLIRSAIWLNRDITKEDICRILRICGVDWE